MMLNLRAEDLCDYELVRQQNIKKREEMMAALMKDFQEFKAMVKPVKPPKPVNKPSPKVSPNSYSPSPRPRRNTRSSNRFSPYQCTPPKTRSRHNSTGSSTTSDRDGEHPIWLPIEEDEDPRPLYVKFRFMKNDNESDEDEDDIKCYVEDMDVKRMRRADYYDTYEPNSPVKRSEGAGRSQGNHTSFNPNEKVLMPENITQSDLRKVAERSGGKIYNAHTGSTCHQCRQKTVDMKTVCRSGSCIGIRGMFCGPCLKNRYGEDVKEALLNPRWMCPPCRDLCNCSICRKKSGKSATGILINIAVSRGFSNVKDYLESLIK